MGERQEAGWPTGCAKPTPKLCLSVASIKRGDVQIREFLHHNGAPRDLVFDLTLTHDRFGDTVDPNKMHKLRHPADINKPLQQAAKEKSQNTSRITRMITALPSCPQPSACSGLIDAEFLRLLFYHAHRESEEFFRLTGQLAQPNQDYVFSKRAAFFNGLKNKVGHIMTRASALRVNLNLQPSAPSLPRPSLTLTHGVPLTSTV